MHIADVLYSSWMIGTLVMKQMIRTYNLECSLFHEFPRICNDPTALNPINYIRYIARYFAGIKFVRIRYIRADAYCINRLSSCWCWADAEPVQKRTITINWFIFYMPYYLFPTFLSTLPPFFSRYVRKSMLPTSWRSTVIFGIWRNCGNDWKRGSIDPFLN